VVTSANVHDKNPLPDLMHGAETHLYSDCAYSSQQALIHAKAPNAKDCTNQRVITGSALEGLERIVNRLKSRVRSRVEHVFAVVKRLWEFNKVRYRGLSKNATHAFVITGLACIYLARMHLMG
jgi:IS5 family transposase